MSLGKCLTLISLLTLKDTSSESEFEEENYQKPVAVETKQCNHEKSEGSTPPRNKLDEESTQDSGESR